MRDETKEGLLLILKSILVLVGVIMVAAGAVDLVVAGFTPWSATYLAAGLVLAGIPLASAFRSALRAKRAE